MVRTLAGQAAGGLEVETGFEQGPCGVMIPIGSMCFAGGWVVGVGCWMFWGYAGSWSGWSVCLDA